MTESITLKTDFVYNHSSDEPIGTTTYANANIATFRFTPTMTLTSSPMDARATHRFPIRAQFRSPLFRCAVCTDVSARSPIGSFTNRQRVCG